MSGANSNKFWDMYELPTQDTFFEVEAINPAEAYRRQADAINHAGPLYAELEVVESALSRISRSLKELRMRVLAQNMPVPSSSTRTTDLVEGFILKASETFVTNDGTIRDVSSIIIKLSRRKVQLELKLRQLDRKLNALEAMADKCDRIMNWAKHEARLEFGSRRS